MVRACEPAFDGIIRIMMRFDQFAIFGDYHLVDGARTHTHYDAVIAETETLNVAFGGLNGDLRIFSIPPQVVYLQSFKCLNA